MNPLTPKFGRVGWGCATWKYTTSYRRGCSPKLSSPNAGRRCFSLRCKCNFHVHNGGLHSGLLGFEMKQESPVPTVYKISASRVYSLREPDPPSKVTEKQRNIETQESEVSEEIEEFSQFVSKIQTIGDAVEVAVEALEYVGERKEDFVFVFCRALLSVELSAGRKFSIDGQRRACRQLWNGIQHLNSPHGDFNELEVDFLTKMDGTRIPYGFDPLTFAMHQTNLLGILPRFKESGPKIGRLLTYCFHLQHIAGGEFYISARTAARVLGYAKPTAANNALNGLVIRGDLIRTKKGEPGKGLASRYLLKEAP